MELDSEEASYTMLDLSEEELECFNLIKKEIHQEDEYKSTSVENTTEEEEYGNNQLEFGLDIATINVPVQQKRVSSEKFQASRGLFDFFKKKLVPSSWERSESSTGNSSQREPYEKVQFVGGRKQRMGGDRDTEYAGAFQRIVGGHDGLLVQKIGVWVGKKQINCIKIWLSDGQSEEFGVSVGKYNEYVLQTGETITSMQLSGNGESNQRKLRLGAINFSTNRSGSSFAAKISDKDHEKQTYPVDVGSGLCIGAIAHLLRNPDEANELLAVGFIFIKNITNSMLQNVHYPTIASAEAMVVVEEIDSLEYDNRDNKNESTVVRRISNEVTEESEWSISVGAEMAGDFKVSSGMPELLTVEIGYSVKLTAQGTYQRHHIEVKTREWEIPITIPPESRERIKITTGRSCIDIPYEGDMVLTTRDGSTLQYPVKGTYRGVSYTDIKVIKEPI